MKLRVLGSAAGGGFPQWNCNCPMCKGVRSGSLAAQRRTQSSIAISDTGDEWVLFNTSPDILQQLQSFEALQPGRSLRDTGIRSIVLMDAQIDHTTGLLMLREHTEPLSLWCTTAVKEDLSQGNPLFKVLEHYCNIDWHELNPAESPVMLPGASTIQLQALPLTSNAPPYSPHRDQPVPGDTIGMLMTDTATGRRLFYAPGLGEMEAHVWQAMQSADVVLVDGTVWTDDEMIRVGASKKTGLAMGHLSQSGAGGMIEWLDKLPSTTRKVLIHINNTNPILDENSKQRKLLAEHGIEVSFDGMEIDL
ncbi:MAG: pyrroloquinoline quinone biosynthesis protein PqqB [Granulosicoccus sp.]